MPIGESHYYLRLAQSRKGRLRIEGQTHGRIQNIKALSGWLKVNPCVLREHVLCECARV
jgi:hypothetical protein